MAGKGVFEMSRASVTLSTMGFNFTILLKTDFGYHSRFSVLSMPGIASSTFLTQEPVLYLSISSNRTRLLLALRGCAFAM